MLTPQTISELNILHDHAEHVYGPIGDNYRGEAALAREYREVLRALDSRDDENLYRELIDVANVATRWAQALESGEIRSYRK